MKIIVALFLLMAASSSQAQVRTLTRTVILFGDLERKLATATNGTERASYLTDDFEVRRCASPGTPLPRDEWLAQPAQQFSFSQQAVHDYGDTALYSAMASTADNQFAIVDTWRKQGDEWKLSVRYLCPATGDKPVNSRPKRY